MIEFVRASGAGTSQKSKDVEEEPPQPQYSVFSRDEVSPGRVGRGLQNLGNTCFFNSVLQVLVYTGPLQRFLLSKQHTAECKRKRGSTVCTLCLLQAHALKVFNSSKAPMKPAKRLLEHIPQIASSYKAGRQEDAHECLIHFLDSCPQHVSLSFSHLLYFLVKSCCKFRESRCLEPPPGGCACPARCHKSLLKPAAQQPVPMPVQNSVKVNRKELEGFLRYVNSYGRREFPHRKRSNDYGTSGVSY